MGWRLSVKKCWPKMSEDEQMQQVVAQDAYQAQVDKHLDGWETLAQGAKSASLLGS